MRKMLMLIAVMAFSSQVFAANKGEKVDLYGKHIIKVNVSVHPTDSDSQLPGIQTTDVILYIADSADQKYDPDLIGTQIDRVDFRVDGGTGLLIYNIMKSNLEKKLPINVEGVMGDSDVINGRWVTDWPQ